MSPYKKMSPYGWNYKGVEVLIRTTYLEEIKLNTFLVMV
jgi:hypothetical protein